MMVIASNKAKHFKKENSYEQTNYKIRLINRSSPKLRGTERICLLHDRNGALHTFDFSSANKKEAHWARDKNLRDVLVHLYEWHQLLINCIRSHEQGEDKPFLPRPYNWKTYGALNMEFWRKHQNTSLEEAKEMLQKSHTEVMRLAESFSNEELFTRGMYKWCGDNAMGSYFVSNTSSHYNWALKKLKAHRKICNERCQSKQ